MERTKEEDREAAMQELEELERNIEEIPKLLVWTYERIDRIKDLLMSNPGMIPGDRPSHSGSNTTPQFPPVPAKPTRALSPEPLDSAVMMKWKTFFAPTPNERHSNADKYFQAPPTSKPTSNDPYYKMNPIGNQPIMDMNNAFADTTDCMIYPSNGSYEKVNPHHSTTDKYFQAPPTSKPSTSNDPYYKMNPNATQPIVDYRFFGNPSTVPTTSNDSNTICNTNEPTVSPPLFSKPGTFNFGNLRSTSKKSEKSVDVNYFYHPESAPAFPTEEKSEMVYEQKPSKRYPDEIFIGCNNQQQRRQAKDLYQAMNPHLFPRLPIHRRIVEFKRLADEGRLVGAEASFELMRLERFRNLAPDGSPAKLGKPTMLDWIVKNVERYDAEEKAWEEMQQPCYGKPP
ncbi:hypothetical protein DdX_16665 [Ditylenchus destructor]|uniref:Uncharacterized protein n=1 Tax=Ditylenchus destructor TaxID=166010 RepID=A0AAD4MNJ8_9BILA|nr:hypothetical protein DdX_16665 [Ditylenchus destructor]